MKVQRWEAQMRRGSIELILLTMLKRDGEKYGVDIIDELKRSFAIEFIESSLYPIMNRLSRDKMVTSRWSTDNPGHPRKYYSITAKGIDIAGRMDAKLNDFVTLFNKVKHKKQRSA